MADYQCFPLWENSPGAVGNINPDDLPISSELRNRLLAWADRFDATLDNNNPANSGFKVKAALEQFRQDGEALVHELQEELGQSFQVRGKF